MQIWKNLLRVIFMLSTIVNLADCCSSRILLLKKHSYKIVHQYKIHNYDPAQQQIQEKIAQNLNLNSIHNLFNMNMSSFNLTIPTLSTMQATTDLPSLEESIENDSSIMDSSENVTETSDNPPTSYEMEDLGPLPPLPALNIFEMPEISQIQLEHLPPGAGPPDLIEDTNCTTNTSELLTSTTSILKEISNHDEIDKIAEEIQLNRTKMLNEEISKVEQSTKIEYDLYLTIIREIISLECDGYMKTDYCLHGGRCFAYHLGFYSCECADGYIGERCESKSVTGYNPKDSTDSMQPKIRKARIVFSFPMFIAISVIYVIIAVIIIMQRLNKKLATGMPLYKKRKHNLTWDLV